MSQKILFYEELKTKNIFELIPVFNEFLLKMNDNLASHEENSK